MIIVPILNPILFRQMSDVKVLDVKSDTTDLTTYTFSACNLGDLGGVAGTSSDTYIARPHHRAVSRKFIAVIVHGEDALATFNVSSVTIGGVAGSEIVDRGGGTNAINTAIYTWNTAGLGGIANTDIVVTWSEAITACAIGVLLIDNIGVLEAVATNSATSTGTITLNPQPGITTIDRMAVMLVGTTCATGGGTETVQASVTNASAIVAPMMLYESNNAEIDFAAFWSYVPSTWAGATETTQMAITWSGTGAGDGVAAVFV